MSEILRNRLLSLSKDDFQEIIEDIFDIMRKSGCKSIEFRKFNFSAGGVSIGNNTILINENIDYPFNDIVYIILHELGHQYQYKKYGINYANDFWLRTLTEPTLVMAKEMVHVEDVANRYARIKMNQYKKKFGLKESKYQSENLSDIYHYTSIISNTVFHLKREKVNDLESINKFFKKMML